MFTNTAPASLDELMDVLRSEPQGEQGESADYARDHGLRVAHGVLDWTDLPVFGGDEPADTAGVWSWDAMRLLVGSSADELMIVPRDA